MVKSSQLIAVCIIASLIGLPTLSLAKARGGGGFSSGARGGSSSMGMGSRGSRTYQDNGAKPIEQSTTAKPSTTAPPTAASSPAPQPAPAASSSWWQRNPLLAGIAGGLAGTWIGHMLFGATESDAKTTEATDAEPGSASSSFGLVLLLMLIGAGALYYFKKVHQTPAPVFTGLSRNTAARESLLDLSSGDHTDRPTTNTAYNVTTEDKAAFQQLLTDIQSAWSAQDVAALRRHVTPEILSYFSTALAEDTSRGVQNHVEGVTLLKGDVREAWSENDTDYATVDLRWSARDYTVSTTIPRGEPGYLVEGSEETPTESCEVWTFMRVRDGQWLLSAIQQQ